MIEKLKAACGHMVPVSGMPSQEQYPCDRCRTCTRCGGDIAPLKKDNYPVPLAVCLKCWQHHGHWHELGKSKGDRKMSDFKTMQEEHLQAKHVKAVGTAIQDKVPLTGKIYLVVAWNRVQGWWSVRRESLYEEFKTREDAEKHAAKLSHVFSHAHVFELEMPCR